jgi:mannitol-1-phosphate 5-dehydrogenase
MADLKAVHFGAGNIGRGFVGLILHNAGYEIVFADVNAELIEALAKTPSYQVHEVGVDSKTWTVDNYRALNSATHDAAVIAEIATADVVTTAVGPNVLRFVAPLIAAAIVQRDASRPPLAVMACENAINATDMLRAEVEKTLTPDAVAGLGALAVFANTAVDRIVPNQAPGAGLDVTVEDFFEWVIERGPFGDSVPAIGEADFVDDLAPFIERKLFTVNTGHATTAYFGHLAGAASLADAIVLPDVFAAVSSVLAETKELLVAVHGFAPEEQEAYLQKNLKRFANPALPDTPERVGRQPIRKLGRHERFIGPAAQLAERGLDTSALLAAIGAALRFDVAEDSQSVELQALLRSETAVSLTGQLTGLDASHPLFDRVESVVAAVQGSL